MTLLRCAVPDFRAKIFRARVNVDGAASNAESVQSRRLGEALAPRKALPLKP